MFCVTRASGPRSSPRSNLAVCASDSRGRPGDPLEATSGRAALASLRCQRSTDRSEIRSVGTPGPRQPRSQSRPDAGPAPAWLFRRRSSSPRISHRTRTTEAALTLFGKQSDTTRSSSGGELELRSLILSARRPTGLSLSRRSLTVNPIDRLGARRSRLRGRGD